MRWLILAMLICLGCDDDGVAPSPDMDPLDAQVDAAPDGMALDMRAADMADGLVDMQPLDMSPDMVADMAPDMAPDMAVPADPLMITEFMAKNDGAWVDEIGETDDWIELHNNSAQPLSLAGYRIGDDPQNRTALPPLTLSPGAYVIFWADDDLDQGRFHLPFKLSSGGEGVYLWAPDGTQIAGIEYGPMAPNESWQWYPGGGAICRWATPDRANGDACGPPPPPEAPEVVTFDDYTWSDPWPFPATPLVITELALRPAGFVEVLNSSAEPVDLRDFTLRLGPHAPGIDWPDRQTGAALALPAASLSPGERIAIPVEPADVAPIAADPLFEGVLTLWTPARNFPVDRVDFMHWPEGAALTRVPDATGRHRFCAALSRGAPNVECDPLPARAIGNRLRHLRTPSDFSALAEGGVATGIASVKTIVDMQAGDTVHLISAEWDLHYTFVREIIDGAPHLDRCDPDQNAEHLVGWRRFSAENYTRLDGRRYLLGTLVHHGGPDLRTAEFTPGDLITGPWVRRAFFSVMARVQQPQRWFLRPQSPQQIESFEGIEGQAPMVGPNAPFRGLTYQPLTETVGYGVLQFVPVDELDTAPLGAEVIVVTDQVPNDIPLTGGLITEAFQTPLAHVNLLSRNRNTPNMALPDARTDPRLAPLFGELVRLEVAGAGFTIERANPAEAQAFWESRRPDGPPLMPRLDTRLRGITPLAERGLADLPRVGAKAAQLAELARVISRRADCPGPVLTPDRPMAIPVVHSLEHYQASGAAALLAQWEARPEFGDPAIRAMALAEVRAAVRNHPVEPALLAATEAYLRDTWGEGVRVRFRSSSNTEDLPGFNGAGLYTSISAELGDADRSVEDALRTVWASLYNARAYDERSYFNIARDGVAMGVLVHPAFLSERANGVGISRNVIEPTRTDAYINVQKGEATVTNPAPGVSTEQLLYRYRRSPRIARLGESSLSDGPVLSDAEIANAACVLRAIHDHFEPLIDPAGETEWFAMDIEFKLLGAARALLVKQARPYSFGAREVPVDCREL